MTPTTSSPSRPPFDWHAIAADLLTNALARELAGETVGRTISRNQLLRWRRRERDAFPQPAISVEVPGGMAELWSRYEVSAWAAAELERIRS